MSKHTEIKRHYENLADHYNDALFFVEGYRQWKIEVIVEALHLQPGDSVVDLGGGTGLFARMMYESTQLQHDILCVDMCDEMLKKAGKLRGVSTLCTDALSFAQREDITYNKIFIKEAIHHFHDRIDLFKGIARQLESAGRLLIITRPPKTKFPFFEAASKGFEQGQPHYDVFKKELEEIGFLVDVQLKQYPLSLEKMRWFEMLRQRFMSHLSAFSDVQIEQGIQELEKRYHDREQLSFTDILVFITGVK